ncbi:MAG: methylated-DNA--[protein]-cysteine S-methyltransferase [Prolixibacteraceae bacterium]
MRSYFTSLESPVGRIVLVSNDTHLKSLSFSNEQVDEPEKLPEILLQTVHQLNEYFAGTRYQFDLELDPDGSSFQRMVWQELLKVPYGSTKSYREIALKTGSALNTRAVGTANGKNPISIIVPCHRIIGSDGKMVGYAGGLERKKWLLLHESQHTKRLELF